MVGKKNKYYSSEDWIEKSIPQDHCLKSHGKTGDAKW